MNKTMEAERGLKEMDHGSQASQNYITAHIDGPDWAA
jgi:hypothetical protein